MRRLASSIRIVALCAHPPEGLRADVDSTPDLAQWAAEAADIEQVLEAWLAVGNPIPESCHICRRRRRTSTFYAESTSGSCHAAVGLSIFAARSVAGRRRGPLRKAAKDGTDASPADVLAEWKKVYRRQACEEHPPLDQVARAMAQTGEMRLASSVLERASTWRIELDSGVYVDLLKGCQRGADDVAAESLLQAMRESEVTPDVSMYEAMATAVSRRRCTRIQSVITSQLSRKKDLVRVTDEQISQHFEEMLSTVRGNLKNISELRRALILLAKTGRFERAEAFFAEVRRSLPEDVAGDAMAAPYAAAGLCQEDQSDVDAAQKSRKDKALEAAVMTEVGVWKICKGFFLRFIGPLALVAVEKPKRHGGEPQKALQLLSAAREQQLPADPLAYETAVKCCRAVGQKSWLQRLCTDSYQALGQLMESQVPAEQQYEAFRACARAWALSGHWAFALQLLGTIHRDHWGARTQSTMVQACLESGAAAEAEGLFNSMLQRGEEPDVLAYHAMMLQYTRADAEAEFLRKNSMSVVGLNEELAALALRIFLEKWKTRCLNTHSIRTCQQGRVNARPSIHGGFRELAALALRIFLEKWKTRCLNTQLGDGLVTTLQVGVESLREWAPAKSKEKRMQQYLSNLLRKEYSLEVVTAKRGRTTTMEKAHQLAYRPPSTEDFD
ncbi:hypothetical protein AK812_SmicGene29549 [Symbiodinium microadriaticum]|uniref:Pentatricopeptide repeat-containing protein, chloroplastic n=1 Tax=Symbiodinium microadriaticum TaxID=2951 RepID=A0A1Q9D1H6_SYMMI|nr:hypothetical protein AK812_SmicGene29549 [Symbiodinium microadriaticum]